MTEIQRIRDQLIRAYSGASWHGPNVIETLGEVRLEQVLIRHGSSHNIAELVHHLFAWRTYLIQQLKGKEKYEVADDFNFVSYEDIDEVEWERLQKQLEDSQRELLALLTTQTDELLERTVPNRKFNFYVLLHGLIQHDLYHAGQIKLLIKK